MTVKLCWMPPEPDRGGGTFGRSVAWLLTCDAPFPIQQLNFPKTRMAQTGRWLWQAQHMVFNKAKLLRSALAEAVAWSHSGSRSRRGKPRWWGLGGAFSPESEGLKEARKSMLGNWGFSSPGEGTAHRVKRCARKTPGIPLKYLSSLILDFCNDFERERRPFHKPTITRRVEDNQRSSSTTRCKRYQVLSKKEAILLKTTKRKQKKKTVKLGGNLGDSGGGSG